MRAWVDWTCLPARSFCDLVVAHAVPAPRALLGVELTDVPLYSLHRILFAVGKLAGMTRIRMAGPARFGGVVRILDRKKYGQM